MRYINVRRFLSGIAVLAAAPAWGLGQPNTVAIGEWVIIPGETAEVVLERDCVQGALHIHIAFSEQGADRLRELTREAIGQPLPIRLGNEILIQPTLTGEIADGRLSIVDRSRPDAQAQQIARQLQQALDLPEEPLRECPEPRQAP